MSPLFELSNQQAFFLMTGLVIVFGLVSGFIAYYSLKMRHTQHGHDEEH